MILSEKASSTYAFLERLISLYSYLSIKEIDRIFPEVILLAYSRSMPVSSFECEPKPINPLIELMYIMTSFPSEGFKMFCSQYSSTSPT